MSNLPWLEKQRPKQLRDIVGNSSTLEQLQSIVTSKCIPNLLLSGPPGTGKTTCVMAIARELMGEDNMKDGVMELNASDDRGIDVVREKIVTFAKKKVTLPQGVTKIVILDEADSMTDAAMQALRVVMTDQQENTRFALACNESSRIIEPIQSRCAIVRFTRLTDEQVLRRVLEVGTAENANVDPEGADAVVWTAEGDMRAALNNMQASQDAQGSVTKANIFAVCDLPQPDAVTKVLSQMVTLDFDSAHTQMMDLLNQGYTSLDIMNTMQKLFEIYDYFKDKNKDNLRLVLMREIAYIKLKISEGIDSPLQMDAALGKMIHFIAQDKGCGK